jgi:hypothetical protein
MIDEKMDDLIQRELDGQTTPEESRELQRLLAADGRAREHYARLARVVEMLQHVPALDPPLELKESVLASALADGEASVVAGAPRRPGPRAPWLPRPLRRDFAAFAAGVAAAALGFLVLGQPPRDLGGDPSNLSGTIAPPPRTVSETSVGRESFDLVWVRAEASAHAGDGSEGMVRVELNMEFARDVHFELGFDPTSWVMTALEPDPAFEGRSSVEPGRIRIETVSPGRYVFRLRPVSSDSPTNLVRLGFVGQQERVERTLVVRPRTNGR